MMTTLTTSRLLLQPFSDAHFAGLRTLNTDPQVMRFITGRPETEEETHALIARVKTAWSAHGYSWWAFIERATGKLIGSGCIQNLERVSANPLEIGWRLHPDAWGKGYASEAARGMADFAFEVLLAPQLCAVCHQDNADSAKVMQRLGMHYRGIERWYNTDTMVYSMTRAEWAAASTT
jgi:RimJ/RimL family protein N-acetyltransferase